MRLEVPAAEVVAAREGDREALERILEAAWPHAYRIALGIVRDPSIAADAAQDAAASAYRTIAGIRDAGAFTGWFYRIVVRAAHAAVRRERVPFVPPLRYADASSDDRIDIARALDHLSSSEREAVVLHFFAGLDSREIARVCNVPDGTVRYRLFSAKRKLRVLLSSTILLASEVPAHVR